MPTKSLLQKVLDAAGSFVVKQKGCWDHDAWEAFVAKVEKMGVVLDDDSKRNLGNVLEAAKYFYELDPPKPAKKKAASRKKAPAKKSAAGKKSSA